MKRCAYCGAKNDDEAVQCSQCGTSKFVVPAPPVIKPPKISKPKKVLFHILVTLGVWLVVSGLSLYVAWNNTHGGRIEQVATTEYKFMNIDDAIKSYHEKFKTDPKSLKDLEAITNESPVSADDLLDGWGHPFVFSYAGTKFLATSYGRDGKPGGQGLDADLTSTNWDSPAAVPTFRQFLFEMHLTGVIMSCLVCGGLAGLLACLTIRLPDLSRRGLVILAVKLAYTAAGAIFVGGIISALHVPSGH